ncbi:hypothetical protein Poli38472_005531 [Pythium oligandrum]|uniref:AMP-dependent synthetase/ligase domain-containing protein n=1 Tax=Pythium oligandrum TaxID=41045 RepID=A0A8K1CH58_PYTOL|nr:hypothetical protein Poli38472_005531 [Pythium oligandrum]|eukprot:TMW62913.1 hypothetical protein Poli38472_005531 [Pythium oligandrum]
MSAVQAVGYSTTLPGTERPGHGAIHRSVIPSQNPITDTVNPFCGLAKPHCESVYHNFLQSTKEFADHPCLGVQPIVAGEARPFEWLTYDQVGTRVVNLASGMMHFELLPRNAERQRMIAIYMKNSIDWIIAEQAAYSFGTVVVALYDSLGADSAEFILNQTELPTIVCTSVELAKLVAIRDKCPHLQNVIVSGSLDDALEARGKEVGLHVFTMTDLEVEGKKDPKPPQPPREEDIATIMYTSGTTGDPKGVVITHKALLSNAQGSLDYLTYFKRHYSTGSVYLSYLPLAHIYERSGQINCLRYGARIGFSQNNPLKLIDDIRALRPTVFCSVPRLLNRIHDLILAKMRHAPKVKRALFFTALNGKLKNLEKHGKTRHAFWDRTVFSKVAESMGLDQCQIIISGSAPLSSHVLAFWRVVFPADFAEGYGQTETSSGITAMHLTDPIGGYVGGPMPSAEVKLEAVQDMGYLITDREHGDEKIPCVGRGEICVRGPCLFSCYYKMPDKTAETIDSDGWLHTGDIGLWSPLGHLKIIDRKKNIFKLSQGEYVAPEKIENALITCPSVAQIFVTGDSFHSHLVAIIVPEELVMRMMAAANGITNATLTLQELCDQPQLKQLVQKELDEASTRARLAGFERVKQIYLHHELFSVENELLTPTFKLRRTDAERFFKKQIEQLYVLSGDAVAAQHDN